MDIKSIEMDEDFNVLLSNSDTDLGPSFFQSSSVGPRPVFREITNEELEVDEEGTLSKGVTWTRDLSLLPPVSHDLLYSYLVEGTISVDNRRRGAIKHKILGYQLYKENFVKKLRVKPMVKGARELFLVKCNVVASMKKDRYEVYIHLCQKSGEVFYAKCSCKAGAGGCCKHVAATLYQLVDYKELNAKTVPDDKTCTDILQQWHVPGEAPNLEAVLFSNLTFEKADLDKDKNKTRKRPLVAGKRKHCSTPLFAKVPSSDKIKKLSMDLKKLGQGTVMATLLEGNSYNPTNFFNSSITERDEPILNVETVQRSVINKLFEVLTDILDTSLLADEQTQFVKTHLDINLEAAIIIEKNSLEQSNSCLWYEERSKRLTASNFGAVINRRKGIYPASLLKKVLPSNTNRLLNSEACQWGKTYESVAISMYEKKFNREITNCGLVVNPKWPWLGCSPDGITFNNEKLQCIEVKCPFSKREMTIQEACEDKTFFLQIIEGKPKLKEKHVYFYQCQGVMAVTEVEELDFIVFTKKEIHVETIKFQKENWNNKLLKELTTFYFDFMSSEIFKAN